MAGSVPAAKPKSAFRALAVDPGGTTGLCLALKNEQGLTLYPSQARLTAPEMLRELRAKAKSPAWVICESFEFRKGARAGLILTSVELIGVIKAFCEEEKRLFMQTAYTGKSYYTDAVLKSMGLYVAAKPHAMDATRHLLHWYHFKFGYQFNDRTPIKLGGGT